MPKIELPAPVRLRGANLVPKPSDLGLWRNMYLNWDWAGWIKFQIDQARAIGCNAIRCIGDVAGVKLGLYTEATYLAHIRQMVEYCQSQGMYFYGCAGGPGHWNGCTVSDIAALSADYCATVAGYSNVFACDVQQEIWNAVDYGTTYSAGAFAAPVSEATMLAYVAQITAACRAAAPGLPLTYSLNRQNNSAAMWDDATSGGQASKLDAYVDFFDFHAYYQPGASDMAPFFAEHGYAKKVLIGEHGCPVSSGGATRTAWLEAQKTLCDDRRILGSFVWSICDQDASDSNNYGFSDNAGSLRSDVTPSLETYANMNPNIIYSRTWDESDVTAGAVPADWTAETGFTVAAAQPFSAPNALKYTAGSGAVNVAYRNATDGRDGNLVYSQAIFVPDRNCVVGILSRLSAPSPWSGNTCYAAQIAPSGAGGVNLYRRVAGAQTQIGPSLTDGTSLPVGLYYALTLTTEGNRISVNLQRADNGQFLGPDGSWSAQMQDCISVYDSSAGAIGGDGRNGVYCFASGAPVYFDDVILAPIPTTEAGGSLDTAAVAAAIVTALLGSSSVGTLDPSTLATAASVGTLQTSVSSVVTAVAALPAAELGAAIITIPGDHTTSGNPVTLTHKQVIALEDAVRGGDNTTGGTPAANATVTVTYYLRGQPKTTGNVAQVSTVTYGAGGQQTGRVDKVASPFPSF